MRDFANSIHPVRALSPVAAGTSNLPYVSQIINVSGYEGLVFVILIGTNTDANVTFAVLVEHGNVANLSDAAAVPDAQLTGTEAQAGFAFGDDNETRKIGYVGSKQYVRMTITPAGNDAGDIFIAAGALLCGPRFAPTPNPPV